MKGILCAQKFAKVCECGYLALDSKPQWQKKCVLQSDYQKNPDPFLPSCSTQMK